MPVGDRKDPYHSFNFRIVIGDILAGGFSECSGLQVEIEFFDYREGGVNEYVHRFAGSTKHPPLVLKRGLAEIDGLWNWHQQVVQWNIQRKNATIYLLDKKGETVMRWEIAQALPVKWTGPELRADSGNVAFESVELTHQGLRWSKG